jgi:hypothetical protein
VSLSEQTLSCRDTHSLTSSVLSSAIEANDGYSAVRALQEVRHDRLQKKLFVLDKDARLRSGTRGMAARKALTAFEKVVAESEAL